MVDIQKKSLTQILANKNHSKHIFLSLGTAGLKCTSRLWFSECINSFCKFNNRYIWNLSNLTCLKSGSCQVWLHLICLAVALVRTTERLQTGPQVEVNWMCHSSQESRWHVAPLETLSFLKSPLWSESLVGTCYLPHTASHTATICPHLFSLCDIPPYTPHPHILTGQLDEWRTILEMVQIVWLLSHNSPVKEGERIKQPVSQSRSCWVVS